DRGQCLNGQRVDARRQCRWQIADEAAANRIVLSQDDYRSVRGSAKRWHGRERRVDLDAAHEIKRRVERLVVPRIKRNVGLRPGLLLPIAFEVTKQGRFTAQVATSLELLRHVLQHLDVRSDALGLD